MPITDMDCAKMRRLALDGGGLASPLAQKHLEECAPCRALFADGLRLSRLFGEAATQGVPGPTPSFEALEAEIARDRRWWTVLAELPTRMRWLLAAVTLTIPVALGVVLHRHNLAEYPLLRLIAELAALASVILICCWLWIRPLFKRPPGDLAAWMVLLLALAVPWTLAALPAALPSSPAPHAFLDAMQRAARCLVFGSAIAMPVLVFLVAMGRRQAGPPGFGALPAAAAALAGVLGLELHCPDASPSHLLMGHAPIVLILTLLLLLARSLGKRASAGAT